jgi:hypothetical protein
MPRALLIEIAELYYKEEKRKKSIRIAKWIQ